jgi:hypothetical protein
MRYLILIVALCLPNIFPVIAASQGYELPKVQHLDAETRFLCETETTFGWKADAEFNAPETWISRTKYIVEPANQIMQLRDDNYVKVTHTITELGKDNSRFCVAADQFRTECYGIDDSDKLVPRPTFHLVNSKENNQLYFVKDWLAIQSMITMRFGATRERVAFEGGPCLKF